MLESKTIRFLRIGSTSSCAKSGPIKCDKGFKVRFDLRTPRDGDNDWYDTLVYLIDSQVPIKGHYKMVDSVNNKEDPSVHAYGLLPYLPRLDNLKK